MGVLPTCKSAHCLFARCLQRPEEKHWLSWNWSYDGCELPCECWESKPDPHSLLKIINYLISPAPGILVKLDITAVSYWEKHGVIPVEIRKQL